MGTTFVLSVSYSQVAVFDSDLDRPFSMWTEEHVRQGFAWREGAVSFRTLANDGPHLVDLELSSQEFEMSPGAVRIIQTPFYVPSSGAVEIASIADAFPLELPSGMYALRFECFPKEPEQDPRVRFVFRRTAHPTFEILRTDSEISLPEQLLVTASPA